MDGCAKSVLRILSCTTLVVFLLICTVSAAAPTAAFSGTPTSGSAPLAVQFTDQSNSSPTGWAWFFGDETYEGPWTPVNNSSGWTARTYHATVALPDGSIVLMGGQAGGDWLNDTWRSVDDGVTWELVNASSGWTERIYHTSVAVPDGSILLMGGHSDDGFLNDTWRSVDGGATWTCVNASSGWTRRDGHTAVTMPDRSIVLMGGMFASPWWCLNDTWRSVDGGTTWTCVNASSGWMARSGHTSVALPDGSILLMGGVGAGRTFLNDTWRSIDNGTTWTEVNASSGWMARSGHISVALPDGSIILMGGQDGDLNPLNDTWRSADGGATWTQLRDAGWTARGDHTGVVLPDGSIMLMGGQDDNGPLNDTWRLQPTGSSLQNPTHTYTAPGTYPVTLQAHNSEGYSATRMPDYITVTEPEPIPGPVHSGGGGGSTAGPDGGYNVGGNSAVSKVTVTGTGLKTFIVTGRTQSSPGADIPPAPGTPYQYVELTPARFEEITGANITFTIPAAWLAEHGLSPGQIVLYRYNGTVWEALPTAVTDTAGTTVTFMATSPGFSLFAISSAEQADPVTTPTAVTTPTTAETTAQATAEPTAEQTTAVPAGDTMPDFPLPTIAIVTGAVLVLAAGGYLVRRWWIRRQNPALFKDYD